VARTLKAKANSDHREDSETYVALCLNGGGMKRIDAESETFVVETCPTLRSGGRTHSRSLMDTRMAVRRLTPVECERLQGFEDNYTMIPYRKVRIEKLEADYVKYLLRGGIKSKDECFRIAADGPRYKALGNSWAVPCIAWIFDRMDAVDKLVR